MKRNQKRIWAAAVAAVLLFTTLFTGNIFAAETETNRYYTVEMNTEADAAFRQAIIDGVEDVTDAKYGLTPGNYSQKFTYLLYTEPELVGAVDMCWTYLLKNNSQTTLSFTVTYADDYHQQRAAYQSRLPQALAEVKALLPENATDFQKVLVVHDYLVSTTRYATDSVKKEYDGTERVKDHAYIYDASGVFVDHCAVCKGYAIAMKVLLNQLGMDCFVASSNNANHAWNVVKVDGEWYHVDCTLDDPGYDILGRVNHGALLFSTEYLLQNNSAKADYIVIGDQPGMVFTDSTCSSKKYEQSAQPWASSQTAVHYYNGSLYTVSNYCVLQKDGQFFYMPDDSMRWFPQNFKTANYYDCMCRMSGYGSTVYMTSPYHVYKINLDTGASEIVYTPDTSAGLIFGLARVEGKLYCTVDADIPTAPETWIYIPGQDVTYDTTQEPEEEPKQEPELPTYANNRQLSLTVGESVTLTDDSGDLSTAANLSLLDSTVAAVTVSGDTLPGTPAVEGGTAIQTAFAAGRYYVSAAYNGKTYYLAVNGTRLSAVQDVSKATLFTLSGNASQMYLKADSYYLCHSTSALSLSTGSTNGKWVFSGGNVIFKQAKRAGSSTTTQYYLRFNGSSFAVGTSSGAAASLCTVTAGKPAVPGVAYTRIQVTANLPGTTRFAVGDTLYTVTVKEAPVYQTLTVHTVDDIGVKLKDDTTLTGLAGTDYLIEAAAIPGYRAPAALTGTYARQSTGEVTLVYTLATDKAALQKELDSILAQGEYTAESYSAYTAAIQAGKSVADQPRALQSAVDAALKAITDAKSALKVASKTAFVPDTDGINSGSEYLIVLNGKALSVFGSTLTATNVQVQADGIAAPADNAVWVITKSGTGYTLKNKSTGKYLTVASSGSSMRRSYTLSVTSTAAKWAATVKSGKVQLKNSSRYLTISGSSFTLSSSAVGVSLYLKK